MKSAWVTWPCLRFTARRAASLARLARSAPVMPGVVRATWSRSTSAASGMSRVWIRRMASRPARSGGETDTVRSKRPGRVSAGSSTSGRLVAAMTTTPSEPEKPSISVRIWFRVCSRSSWPPMAAPPPRARPMVSISSMKTIEGATLRASEKSSRTREAPTPTIISMNSEAEAEKNGTPASPATARASRVLPVPGGPANRTPPGIRAPRARYCCGFLRKSTTSWSSPLTSSMPATSANVVRLPLSSSTGLGGCLRPSPPTPPMAEPMRRAMNTHRRTSSSIGASEISRLARKLRCTTTGEAVTTTLCRVRLAHSWSSAKAGRWVTNFV